MAYFYVKQSLGTRTTGGGLTKQTGSFAALGAANVYATIQLAIADSAPPVAGDFIFISDASTSTDAAIITIALPDGVQVWSVSDTNLDQYSAGAVIDNTAGLTTDWIIFTPAANGWGAFRGVTFNTNENVQCTAGDPYILFFTECTFQKQDVSGNVMVWGGGSCRALRIHLKDCTYDSAHSSNGIAATGCHLYIDNLIAGGGHVAMSFLIAHSGGLMSNVTEIINTDITPLLSASGDIYSFVANDAVIANVRRCKIGASQGFSINPISRFNETMTVSSVDTGDGYHYFRYEDMFAIVEEDTTQYLNATYNGTNGFSTKIITSAEVSPATPFKYKLCTLTSRDLSGASGETFKVELVSPTAGLTDTDVWIELEYQDNTDQALGVTQDTLNADPLAAGTPLNSSSAVWQVTTDTEYDITEQILQKAAVTNTNVTVYVYIAAALTVNFDPAITVT